MELTEQALTVLERRYLLTKEDGTKETPEEMFRRVAKHVASADDGKYEDDYYRLMTDLKFLPNSPTIMNSGTEMPMLSACFVLPINDDMESIFKAVRDSALICKAGGGVGFSFSELRPENDVVGTTGGVASGPVSFMRIFDMTTDVIKQGGRRRGANMSVLSVHHPDIVKFVRCKADNDSFRNFNISVGMTDVAMKAVEEGEEIELMNPRIGEVVDIINATELFNAITEEAWKCGDPGLLFIDKVNEDNAAPDLGYIIGCNPCQPLGSLLLDGDRLLPIEKGGKNWTSWQKGFAEVIELTCNNGLKLRFTSEHKIMMEDGGWVRAGDAEGKVLRWGLGKRQAEGIDRDQVLRGFLFGDGYRCGGGYGISAKVNPQKEPEVCDLLVEGGFHLQPCGSYYINRSGLEDLSFLDYRLPERDLPDDYLYAESMVVKSFLRGLFEANGSVSEHGQISLKATNRSMIGKVQLLLASFGIPSWIVTNAPSMIEWSNGTYLSRESYNLQIAPRCGVLFGEKIGFISQRKKEKIREKDKPYQGKLKVVSVCSLGEMAVWDYCMLGNPHYNFCQGVVAANCGEQPLLPYLSCNLGSINLSKFVFEDGGIDWEGLRRTIILGIRFLDNVITVNRFPLPEIKEMTELLRPIGLGVMGWADLLIKLGIRYDSEEAIGLAGQLMEFIKEIAYKTSVWLAEEKHPFPHFGKSTLRDGDPIRNSRLLSIAPTGTLSLIANCSGGIEPVFSFKYEREFEGRKLSFVHPEYEKHVAEGGYPEWPYGRFVSAHDISPEWHLKMLSAFQNHVDAGVSKTINLPSSATVEDVKQIYLDAWKLGCKGITVFRDGCKGEQVLTSMEKDDIMEPEFGKLRPRERPQTLRGETTKIRTGCGNLYVTVNYDGGGIPYEVFSALGKGGGCAASQLESISRLISLSLRSGVDVESIVKHLKGIRCPSVAWSDGKAVLSCGDAISSVLQGSILGESVEYQKEATGQNLFCPECSFNLEFKEGCLVCLNCGYSKCG